MRIKKFQDQNEYLLTEDGIWVRNFCPGDELSLRTAVNFNELASLRDCQLFLKNEVENQKLNSNRISGESIFLPKIVVVSDGFGFAEKHALLAALPYKDVAIFGVNGSLAKWSLIERLSPEGLSRTMKFFIANNPYGECLRHLPTKHKYFPNCIASTRTNHQFTRQYGGTIFFYRPAKERNYSGLKMSAQYLVDDYRNPICAAIGLAFRFGVQKLLLLCCDDSFSDERPGSEHLENGLFTYPQHLVSQRIIDANLFWLAKNKEIKIANCSSGINLTNAPYIPTEGIVDFFRDENE